MEKGLVVKKQIFIQKMKEDIRQYYEIQQKQIGKGTYGKIYRAHPKDKPNTLRAIKVIKKSYNNSHLMGEAHILRQLDHPNILKLYSIFEDNQAFYLVTDYLEGKDLVSRLEQGPISESQAREIFKQTLEAISFCHSQNIMHRDVKLDNLVFLNSKTLTLKLIDFGMAFKWSGDLKFQLFRQGLSKIFGSVLYMAPECFKGSYNQKCDLWSLGVVLYAIVSAEFPFQGISDNEIQKNILSFNFTTPIQRLNVSPSLKSLLSRLLVVQQKRFTAKETFEHPWLKEDQSKVILKLNFGKLANFSKFSKIKTLAVSYIASQLSEKQIEKLSVLFRQLDTNHDGYLSVDQIKRAFEQQKEKSSLTELSKLISFIDTDKNGKINYTEFISCCLENSVVFKEENLKAAFRLLDRDQNGRIQKQELIQLLKESGGQKWDPKAVQEIMIACDKNGDGFIDYKEFVQSMSKR